jgi:Na+/proline symporter
MTPLLGAVLAYMLLQFGIGVWASRRIRTEGDYLLAGRRLGYALTTASIFATWFGAETIIGSAGNTYREGVSLASAEPFGYGLCLILMGLLFAVPLWRLKLTTLADFFRARYSPVVERVAAILLIPGSILWAAAQVRAFGHVLTTASTLTLNVAVGVAAGFTILYSAFGGMLADAITDLIQGGFLILGLIIVLAAVVRQLGGPDGAMTAAVDSGRIHLSGAGGAPPLELIEAWAIPVCGSLLATELVSRVIAARSGDVARRSALLAGGVYLAVGIIPVVVGVVGVALAPHLSDPEQLMPTLARELLPTVGYAVFAGGLISAILSTVDTTLLVSAGLLSHNVLIPLFRVRAERLKVLLARAGVVTFGLVAFALALQAEGVFALVEQASAFGSAGSLITITFGLFTRLGGARTALATLVAGMTGYLGARALEAPYPFLTSLALALGTYVVGAMVEPWVARVGRG